MFRRASDGPRVLLIHPGGPYWRSKDRGAWTIPKGGIEPGEDLLSAARREFKEETGLECRPPFLKLEPVTQSGGKLVHCWAFEGAEDLSGFTSVEFEMEWPPRSGKIGVFPEADQVRWFRCAEAGEYILPSQRPLIDSLRTLLAE